MFAKLVFATRMVLGIFYLVSGLNWFLGLIPVLPHIGMPPDLPIKHAVVVEMVNSGWMFQSAKLIEIAFGVALLGNRFLPLMLGAALPVAFITFMLDALILDDLWRWINGLETGAAMLAAFQDMVIGGLCVLLPHLWLMWCYREYYRPALVARAVPTVPGEGLVRDELAGPAGGPREEASSPQVRWLFFAFGWGAMLLQAFNVCLFIGMIRLG